MNRGWGKCNKAIKCDTLLERAVSLYEDILDRKLCNKPSSANSFN